MVESVQRAKSGVPQWGPPKREGSKFLKGGLTAINVGIGLTGIAATVLSLPLGGVAGMLTAAPLAAASYVIDRVKNSVEENDELKHRAGYFSKQVFRTIGIQPERGRVATVEEFKRAAKLNAAKGDFALQRAYDAPVKQRKQENRSSFLMNGGVAIAGTLIPGGGAVAGVAEVSKNAIEVTKAAKEVGKVAQVVKGLVPGFALMGGGMAGGAIASALNNEVVDPQALLEGIHETVDQARSLGYRPSQAISPNLIFMLRLSQDPKLAEYVKAQFGGGKKGFHQMDAEEQQRVVMNPAMLGLARSSLTELAALDSGMDVRELGAASKTIPNGFVARLRPNGAAQRGSFVEQVNASRATNQLGSGGIV